MRPTVRSQPGFATMIVEHPRHAVFSVSTSAWLHRLHVRVTAAAMAFRPGVLTIGDAVPRRNQAGNARQGAGNNA